MLRPLRFALLVTTLAAIWAPAAHAGRPLGLPETLTSAHFQVHYDATPGVESRINVLQANDVAAWAERAYSTYLSWGYPAPLGDGDSYYDLYVVKEPAGSWGGAAQDDPFALVSSAYAEIDSTIGLDERKVAHLVFHLFQEGMWAPLDSWLREAGAEWAAFRFLGFPATLYNDEKDEASKLADFVVRADLPLDCVGVQCGDDVYEQGGYQGWPFLTYLGERFGTGIVKEIHDRGQALGDPNATGNDFVGQVLTSKGATFADVFNDWTVTAMTGGYAAIGLKGTPPVVHSTTATGIATGALPVQKVSVNHLAVRYVALARGNGTNPGPCFQATLTLNVAIPAGVASRPYFFWPAAGNVPVPLAVSGSNATVSVPWDTCTWSISGLLSLPNDTLAVDGIEFTVSGSLTVDTKNQVTSTPPPPGSYTGPTVAAPAGEDAPSIALYGPETLRVSKSKRLVRLVVFSSGQGKLQAQLGATMLGTRSLRAGTNDLRFTLPTGFARTLAAKNVLSLTSISSSGQRGATVTRKLVLTK
jgi:hypothetical protein